MNWPNLRGLALRKDAGFACVSHERPEDILAQDDVGVHHLNIRRSRASKPGLTINIQKYYEADDNVYDVLKERPGRSESRGSQK